MFRRIVSAIMLILILTNLLSLAFNIQSVGAEGTIYIRADGSVDPPTAPIQRNGDSYVLTDNITSSTDSDGILIERDNMTIDGNGYFMLGTGEFNSALGTYPNGIGVSGRNNITAKNLNIEGYGVDISGEASSNINLLNNNISGIYNSSRLYQRGIYFYSCSDITLIGNIVANSSDGGIFIWHTPHVRMSENTIIGCSGFSFSIWESYYDASIDVTNTIDGKPIYYLFDKHDMIINPVTFPSIGYLAVVKCTNMTVESNVFSNKSEGLILAATNDSRIVGNEIVNYSISGIFCNLCFNITIARNNSTRLPISRNAYCILLLHSQKCTVSENNLVGSPPALCGVFLDDTYNSTVIDNFVTGFRIGIGTGASSLEDTITKNNITDVTITGISISGKGGAIIGNNVTARPGGLAGIELGSGVSNTISDNVITSFNCGMRLLNYPINNSIYHNDFINNNGSLRGDPPADPLANSWDNGYPQGGNYWSDYNNTDSCWGPYQNVTGSDGIGDVPHGPDKYPFMEPHGWTSYPLPVETNVTLTDQTTRRATMYFTATGPTGDVGYANVTMPVGFNTTQINVLVDLEPVVSPFPIITTNGTHYFIYVEFLLSTHTITVKYALADVALTGTNIAKTIVGRGYSLNVNLTAANLGTLDESFSVELCANSTVVTTQPFDLKIGVSINLTCEWNTTGVLFGNYTITAYVPPLEGEDNLADNNCTYHTPLHVGVPGDVSGPTVGVYDGTTNMRDINYLILRFNSQPDSSNWNPNADVNNDGVCNLRDIQIAILNFNQHE